MRTTEIDFRPLLRAGTLLGVGLGGLFESLVSHRLLQLHHLLSSQIIPDSMRSLRQNIFWDGVFDLLLWLTLARGCFLVWQISRNPNVPKIDRCLAGSFISGWGMFELVEGSLNHFILDLHHLLEHPDLLIQLVADVSYLILGLVLVLLGKRQVSRGKSEFYRREIASARSAPLEFKAPGIQRSAI